MKKGKENLYIDQLQTDVALLSFMTVVTVFFTGLLLTGFNSFDVFIKVPISFLIISIFAFLFSTLILGNTASKLIEGKFAAAERHITYGYVISEYLGIYLFVISIPLVINALTEDNYLRFVTLITTLVGIAFYQFMRFSILESHFPKTYKFFSTVVVFFGAMLFFSQIYSFYFVPLSIVFILVIVLIAFLAPNKKFQ